MVKLPLFRGDVVVGHAVVDAQDAHLAAYRWRLHPNGYVQRSAGRSTLLLHREVCGLDPGDGREADHINRVKHDCRRSNLRVVTRAQNQQNFDPAGNTTWRGDATSSSFRGVSYDSRRAKWKATVTVAGTTHHLGRFATEAEAAAAATAFRAEHMPYAAATAAA